MNTASLRREVASTPSTRNSVKFRRRISTARHTPRHSSGTSTSTKSRQDRIDHRFQLLLLRLVLLLLGHLVRVEPRRRLVDLRRDGGLVIIRKLGRELLITHRVLHGVAVVLERVLRLDSHSIGFVLGLVALGLVDHAVDLVLAEAALVVFDRDLLLLARRLLDGGD